MEDANDIPNEEKTGRLQQHAVGGSAPFRPRSLSECCKALGNGIACEVRSHLVWKCLAAWDKGRIRVKVEHGKYHAGWAALEPF